jgi:lysophospholipase L1-like esterase
LAVGLVVVGVLAVAGRAGIIDPAGATPRLVSLSGRFAPVPVHKPSRRRRPISKATGGAPEGLHWLATWGASMQAPTTADTASEFGFANETIRQIVLSSIGGSEVRVRFSNLYGTAPLMIGRATVAIAGTGAWVAAGSIRQLTFGGDTSVVIPPGAELYSDPVTLAVRPLSRLSISVYLPRTTGPATGHGGSRETNFLATGPHVTDEGPGAFWRKLGGWYFIDGVDVIAAARDRGAIVAIGDSITAGVGSSMNGFANWPDDLARRLATLTGPSLSVVDEGIGGNRVLNNSPCCGDSAISRFDLDVLAQTGVRDVILFEGINDIGFGHSTNPLTVPNTPVTADEIIAGYKQLISAAHAAGLQIFGATLLPYKGAHYWNAAGEVERETVNRWILTSGAFDGVINFASVVADPTDPLRLNPSFDSHDHLHPNDAGYEAMADAIDIRALLAAAD